MYYSIVGFTFTEAKTNVTKTSFSIINKSETRNDNRKKNIEHSPFKLNIIKNTNNETKRILNSFVTKNFANPKETLAIRLSKLHTSLSHGKLT